MGFLGSIGKSLGNVVSLATGGLTDVVGLTHGFDGSSQQKDANKMAMKAWNLANDYNHPVAQMERLRLAGLNPLLVYGSGSVAGNTTGAPSLVGGGISTGAEAGMKGLSGALSLLQGNAQLDLTHAQTQASTAAAGASGAQASNLQAQAAAQEKKNEFLEKTLIADLDYKRAQTKLANAQTAKTSAEADITQGEADLFGSVGGAKGASAGGSILKETGKAIRSFLR